MKNWPLVFRCQYCGAQSNALVHCLPPAPKSWTGEVIADNSGKWSRNGLRFATKEEAQANVKDLAWRWTLVRETRVVETDDPVNYRWDATKGLVGLDEGEGA